MSKGRLMKALPALISIVASVVEMIIGIRNGNTNYYIAALALAIFGLILSMSLQSKKSYYQEQLDAFRKEKRKKKKDGGLLGEDEYHLFNNNTERKQRGSLDDLDDGEINKKL